MNPVIIGVIVVVVLIIIPMTVKIVQEYERGVVFRLGRLVGAKGPGLFLIIPFIDRMMKVDLRVITMDVPSQEVITKDNVTVRVNAVVYFRVVDPEASNSINSQNCRTCLYVGISMWGLCACNIDVW